MLVSVRSTATDVPGEEDEAAAFARELRFALDLAVRAGALLMDHYERLERMEREAERDRGSRAGGRAVDRRAWSM